MHYIIKNQFTHCHHKSFVVIFKLFFFLFNFILICFSERYARWFSHDNGVEYIIILYVHGHSLYLQYLTVQ